MFNEFRKDYGLSQMDCERLFKIPHQTISRIEAAESRGTFKPTIASARYAWLIFDYKKQHLTLKEQAECMREEILRRNKKSFFERIITFLKGKK
jgi:transcriptional regulator with XRE-family HTH domain